MKTLLLVCTLLGSVSGLAASEVGKTTYDFYQDYSNSEPLDRSIYHDRDNAREVRKYNPTSLCSDYKKQLVEQALNLKDVKCSINSYPKTQVHQKIRELEELNIREVVKVVNNREIFYILLD